MITRNPEYTLAEDVENLIISKTYVSMVDIMNLAGDEGMGEGRMTIGDDNIVVWADMSEELVNVITSLRVNKSIHIHKADPLVYVMDGGWPNMPMVNRPPKNGYKHPHWLPIVFQPGFRCTTDRQCPNFGVSHG